MEDISLDSLTEVWLSDEYQKLGYTWNENIKVFPNPFNAETNITYTLEQADNVRIYLYDTQGRLVRKLVDEQQSVGAQHVTWDGLNDRGADVQKGLYYFSMMVGEQHFSGRVIKK